MIVRTKKGYGIKHCSGKDKGKFIIKDISYQKALKMHRAIMASKARRKKR